MPDEKFKIVVFTSYDPAFGHRFLQTFAEALPIGLAVRVHFARNPRRDSTTGARLLNAYRLFSFKGLWRLGTRWALQPWRRRRLFAQLARKGVRPSRVGDVNAPAFLDDLRKWGPDLAFSVACPQIFRDRLLSLPRLGCVNVHNGRLPQYRGLFSIFWQLDNLEPNIEITAHRMTPRIDQGDVVATARMAFDPTSDTLWGMMMRAKQRDAELVVEIASRAARGNRLDASPPAAGPAAYRRFPGPAEIRQFKGKGLKTI